MDPLHLRDDDAWFRRGATLKALFTDRGLLPVVQLGAIGAVGYLTRLPIADSNLLVQRDPSRKDVRSPEPGLSILVGHSTFPSPEFLRSQRIDFLEGPLPPEFRTVWRRTTDGQLAVYQYNPEVMTLVRKHAPELGIIDFVAFLDDYLANLNKKSTAQVARDFEAFKDFYFVRGRDPRRRLIFESYLAAPGR